MDALILSAALDTNGQNFRYVKASRQWGTAEGVLKALAVGHYDPAAVVGRLQKAAEKSDVLRIRSAHQSTHIYQSMPADIFWTRRNHAEVQRLAQEADVIHLNNSWRPWQKLGLRIQKPMLLHHHGTLFRDNPREQLDRARQIGAIQCVSTVDLMRVAPSVLHWMPTAYNIDELQHLRRKYQREPDGRIRVVHAPTNRLFKSSDELEAAVRSLQDEGLPIDLITVEGRKWDDCMAIKATADIYFDQVKLGYGCNAVEAWGMGIPVIAGADDWTLAKMREVYGNDRLPFYEATPATIAAAVRDLATHKAKRTQYAARGLKHVRKFHDELPALTRLAQLYAMTLDANPEKQGPLPPAKFTAAVGQIHIANRYLNFPLETDNPFLANRIRTHALRYPKYGIQEVA